MKCKNNKSCNKKQSYFWNELGRCQCTSVLVRVCIAFDTFVKTSNCQFFLINNDRCAKKGTFTAILFKIQSTITTQQADLQIRSSRIAPNFHLKGGDNINFDP